jgi:hypothetical protein
MKIKPSLKNIVTNSSPFQISQEFPFLKGGGLQTNNSGMMPVKLFFLQVFIIPPSGVSQEGGLFFQVL